MSVHIEGSSADLMGLGKEALSGRLAIQREEIQKIAKIVGEGP